MSSEQKLIERVCRMFPHLGNGERVGIGDDAAIICPHDHADWVITTDAFLENVHFIRTIHPPKAVGYKALARATSDLAAMGARARYFLLTLGLPDACAGAWFDNFLNGMALAARRFGLNLIGGDTTKSSGVLADLTLIGEIDCGRGVLRSGARPGDVLCVSGKLGEAELGWQLVQHGLHKKKSWKNLVKKHLYPEPRLTLGQWLVEGRWATAMIDTSDGLSTDLGHICQASGVGAKVVAEKIPSVGVPPRLQRRGFIPLRMAVDGGEDYELLFTVPKRLAGRLPKKVAGTPIAIIGEITHEKKVVILDSTGRSRPLRPRGWDSFRKKV